jgi:Rad3-related DNA helicase
VKPIDLNLPPKFRDWRPHQERAVGNITRSRRYAFLLDAPTGTGKTVVGAAVQRLLGRNAVYVCRTKQLQDQVLQDFPYARVLKGRSNYPCARYPKLFPEVTAELCTHDEARNPCTRISECEYKIAKRVALRAPLAVLNMAYFLAEANYVGGFETPLLIADEVDSLEDEVLGFVELVVTKRQIERLGLEPPRYKTKFEAWLEWFEQAKGVVLRELLALEDTVSDEWGTEDFRLLRRRKELESFYRKLNFAADEVDGSWVWYPEESKWTFKPVWISRYAPSVVWKHADRVLGMSATILSPGQLAKNLGLGRDGREFDYLSLPSLFPVENRPVYYRPVASLSHKTMEQELPRLAAGVDRILRDHPSEKVLIHTTSYRVRDYLVQNLPYRDRFLTHSDADRARKLEEFKASGEPLVLVSPSMDRGVDLPEEDCRVVIIAKCPFPSLADPQVSRRLYGSKDGKRWYAHKTASTIIQMTGRAVRSPEDHAVSYILDAQFERFLGENRDLFPRWWLEALKEGR